jgi:hypothetical protein
MVAVTRSLSIASLTERLGGVPRCEKGVMNMSRLSHVGALVIPVVAGLLIGTVSADAQSVVYQGFTHRPVGAATLRVDTSRNVLEVGALGPTGEDGVAVKTTAATSWTTRVRTPVVNGLPLRLSWHAIADGRRIGSGLMRQTGDQFEVSAVFTGATTTPTFSAQVYYDGRLVGAVGGQSGGGATVPADLCRKVPEFCEITAEFHTLLDGACMIKIVGSKAVPIRLPNGAIVTGNELRLIEEVRPGSHYPYLGFDTMTMLSDARAFEIVSETLR